MSAYERRGSASTGSGCTPAEVADCAARLGVRLPASYRRFLEQYSYATWPDYIYGVHTSGLRAFDVARLAASDRAEAEPPMPPHLVPFAPDGFGNHFCLDTSAFQGDECPVVFWDHELGSGQIPPVTHRSFLEWLVECVRHEIIRESGG
jgi:hypothetical protein